MFEPKPGSWVARPHPVPHPVLGDKGPAACWWVDTPDGTIQISNLGDEEVYARHIAALPEMKEVLKGVLAEWDEACRLDGRMIPNVDEIKAAIAKAEGRDGT